MRSNTSVEKFFNTKVKIDRSVMQSRFKGTCAALGWQKTVALILNKRGSFKGLKIAEVGCGTGTFSLTLNFLGGQTTLIDADDDALRVARDVFTLYQAEANYEKADVLESVPQHLEGKFDVVISGGLAEHFVGEDREKCIAFHKKLLTTGGFAYIGVPNQLSLVYLLVRWFRQITGTWHISIEKPFTFWELEKFAVQTEFTRSLVFGNSILTKDMKDYSLGLISAILDVLPNQIRKKIHHFRNKSGEKGEQPRKDAINDRQIVFNAVKKAEENRPLLNKRSAKDYLSAGIILFGFLEP